MDPGSFVRLVLEPDCFLPDSADSIRVSNRYGSAVVPIHYPRGIGEGLQVYLLKPGQRYYYFHRNRLPIDFLQNSFYRNARWIPAKADTLPSP